MFLLLIFFELNFEFLKYFEFLNLMKVDFNAIPFIFRSLFFLIFVYFGVISEAFDKMIFCFFAKKVKGLNLNSKV
tara:strand:+ start:1351 stop:1575 length:225 start_codon:yes stop_codon:yes gene_type:complete